jgi:hypothetical protein
VIRNFVACLTHMVDAAARTPCDKNRVHVVFKQGKGCHAVTERAIDLENRNYFIVMKQLQMWRKRPVIVDIDASPRSEVAALIFRSDLNDFSGWSDLSHQSQEGKMAGQDDTKGEIELVPTTADGALADNDNRSCGSPQTGRRGYVPGIISTRPKDH